MRVVASDLWAQEAVLAAVVRATHAKTAVAVLVVRVVLLGAGVIMEDVLAALVGAAGARLIGAVAAPVLVIFVVFVAA